MMQDTELDWLRSAAGRLATLYGVERLNEELLCFASWLSLNRYEEDALRKVKADWKALIEQTDSRIAFSFVGSTECGLSVSDMGVTSRAHPNSDVNGIIDLTRSPSDVSSLVQSVLGMSGQFGSVEQTNSTVRAIHIVLLLMNPHVQETGIQLTITFEQYPDCLLTSFCKQVVTRPKFRPLYLFIKYYFIQRHLSSPATPHFVLFSVLFLLEIQRNTSLLSLGDLFLQYFQMFSEETMERSRDRYSFREYYEQMLSQFHCPFDSVSFLQRFRVIASLFFHVVYFFHATRHLSSIAGADE